MSLCARRVFDPGDCLPGLFVVVLGQHRLWLQCIDGCGGDIEWADSSGTCNTNGSSAMWVETRAVV